MDASQPAMLDAEAPTDVEVRKESIEHRDEAPPNQEQPSQPQPQPQPSTANSKPKRAPKAAPNADRPPGKSLLPISRVQKILKADKELPTCAKEAVFLISVATEEFIKRLGQAGQRQAMRDKRTTVQRRDVATAVRRSDEFVFLEEILAAGVPGIPPAPTVKRKPKASVPASDSTNLKDAFVKGKEKAATDADGEGDEANLAHENSQEHPERLASTPPPPGVTQSSQVEKEGASGDDMDVS